MLDAAWFRVKGGRKIANEGERSRKQEQPTGDDLEGGLPQHLPITPSHTLLCSRPPQGHFPLLVLTPCAVPLRLTLRWTGPSRT